MKHAILDQNIFIFSAKLFEQSHKQLIITPPENNDTFIKTVTVICIGFSYDTQSFLTLVGGIKTKISYDYVLNAKLC